MSVESPVPKDSALMKDWEAHKATEDYANSLKWVAYPGHAEGSLWALFCAGYMRGAGAVITQEPAPDAALVAEMRAALEPFAEFEPPKGVLGQYLRVTLETVVWDGEHDIKPLDFDRARTVFSRSAASSETARLTAAVVDAAREYVEWPRDGDWEKEVAEWGDNGQRDTWFTDGSMKRHNLLVEAFDILDAHLAGKVG